MTTEDRHGVPALRLVTPYKFTNSPAVEFPRAERSPEKENLSYFRFARRVFWLINFRLGIAHE